MPYERMLSEEEITECLGGLKIDPQAIDWPENLHIFARRIEALVRERIAERLEVEMLWAKRQTMTRQQIARLVLGKKGER